MVEEWKAHPKHLGYEFSTLGRARSVDRIVIYRKGDGPEFPRKHRGRILRLGVEHKTGYLNVGLGGKGRRSHWIHGLILETFVGERPTRHYACHKDGDRSNNALENLYWGTPKENVADSRRHGTYRFGVVRKLSEVQKSEIIRKAETLFQTELAREYKVSLTTIANVLREAARVAREAAWANGLMGMSA